MSSRCSESNLSDGWPALDSTTASMISEDSQDRDFVLSDSESLSFDQDRSALREEISVHGTANEDVK